MLVKEELVLEIQTVYWVTEIMIRYKVWFDVGPIKDFQDTVLYQEPCKKDLAN